MATFPEDSNSCRWDPGLHRFGGMEQKTIVYILRSEPNPARRYTGITSNLTRRLQWHNDGENISTADDRPWNVAVSFHFAKEMTARRFEKYLKTGSGREFARRHFDDVVHSGRRLPSTKRLEAK